MLSVRGEGILSWVGDDNFVVEDKTTAFQEVPPPQLSDGIPMYEFFRMFLSLSIFLAFEKKLQGFICINHGHACIELLFGGKLKVSTYDYIRRCSQFMKPVCNCIYIALQ